ncbi:MAG TPA: hypothetical protein VGJ59_17050 [Jatrophihabitantaceae bacterium]|jgi:hypothetical protein
MAGERQSVSDTIEWLSFPRQAYPNFYLNVQRIDQRFQGYLGSIREFNQSVEKSVEPNAKVKTVFLEAGVNVGRGTGAEIAYDLAKPLAQALVLRAYLATVGELQTDARSAPVTDFVLARGRGALIQPNDVADSPQWQEGGISPEVAAEIETEQRRQAKHGTGADPEPLYWATYANTDRGLVVSLLGDASLIGTDARSWSGVEMTYCIFGQKIRDWQLWTLLQPLHVWVEPPGKASWG